MDEKDKDNDIPDSEQQCPNGVIYDKNDEWVKEYIEQFGEEPSFF